MCSRAQTYQAMEPGFAPRQSYLEVHALSPPSGCLSITSDFMISQEAQLYVGPVSQLQGHTPECSADAQVLLAFQSHCLIKMDQK